MSYSYEEGNLHECCAVDCVEAGTEFLTIKPWTASRYGGKDGTTGTYQLLASGYYRKHLTWLRNWNH